MPSENEASRRCAAHDLAADIEGRCVLCRRAAPSAVAAPEIAAAPSLLASRLLTWLLLLLALGSAAVVVGLGVLTPTTPSSAASSAAPAMLRGLANPNASRGAPQRGQPNARAANANATTKITPEPRTANTNTTAAKPVPEAADMQPATVDPLQQQRAAQDAQRDAERHAQVEAQLAGQALAAARRNVSVEMFSTSWCGVCTHARRYMQAHAISFVDHDIDQDEVARARAKQLTPRLSVPIIDVAGAVMIGFSEHTLEENLDRAAHKRLGL